MSKTKKKSGTGQGTGKKGWNRWQSSAKKKKNFKPYTSKNGNDTSKDIKE
jgi:hypothetical protein